MYNNTITINLTEIKKDVTGTLRFRKPKASEMIEVAEAQTQLQDENTLREKQGLKPKEVNAGMVAVIEKLVQQCYIDGECEGEKVTRELFEENFLDLQTVIHVFSQLSDMEGLEQRKAK